MAAAARDDDTVRVELGGRSYAIRIVDEVVASARMHADFWRSFCDEVGIGIDVALVTNETLAPVYGEALADALRANDRRVMTIVLPDGEAYKTAVALASIHDAMLEARFDRNVTVFAVGGGVVGDVAGFAAATYQRGVRFVQVPTTLLAQVDSSVGGKTGINHRLGKNMIGAFHQPVGVLIDIATLVTLPPREYAGGLAEVIKYGAALDLAFFEWIEAALPALVRRDRDALVQAIRRSCELKAAVVGTDETETGDRALLNFGHTFGHAIEGATGYGTWLHGEAVAAGMIVAARLSARLGRVDGTAVGRLVALVAAAGLPVAPPPLSVAEWRHWMASDKKASGGRLRFVLLDGLGRSTTTTVDDAIVDAVLAECSAPAALRA